MGYKNGILLEVGPIFPVLADLRTGRKKRGRPPLQQQPSFYHTR
ncbi:hypothetical protein HMPREF3213_02522 [Heyndrickxia coagulans]|uniref:Uncharacterized protein n=1 Tax=Heyndrickxia coagulans TaxID=1398 RepID=A0A133KJR2_HEYCO|nr:hypothetical protein HMPREF3213_02522 [Heyndrickxia coagulans]